MNRLISSTALAACLTLGLAGLAATTPVQAKTSFMAECSAKYKAAKAAGSITASTKWTDFMKTQCASQDTSSTPATAAPVTPTKAAKTAVSKPATTTKPTAATATANGSFMQQCSTKWQQMKQAGTVPAGLKWTSFVKQNCVVTPTAAATSNDNTVPAEPDNSNYSSYQSMDVATTDKNGKPFTAGQIAAHKRIKECAIEWHSAKQNGTLPGGTKWPQYWSDCNTRLKSQG